MFGSGKLAYRLNLITLFLLCCGKLCAEFSPPLVLPAGAIPVSGTTDDFCLIHSLRGTAYLILIEEGRPRFFLDSGEGFTAFTPEQFPAEITGARNLQILESPPLQYAAFIGRENGQEGIYVLGINFTGELHYYPAAELQGLSSITAFSLAGSVLQGAVVYVQAGTQLSCTARIGAVDAIPVQLTITSVAEKIAGAKGGFEVLREPAYPLGRGWFTTARGSGLEVSFFYLGEDLLLRKERVAFFEKDFEVLAGLDGEGKSYFALIQEGDLFLFRGDGGAFNIDQLPFSFGEMPAEPEDGSESNWISLCAWNYDPLQACFLIPGEGELAAGEYREGKFEILRRINLMETAGDDLPSEAAAPPERYRKSLAINGTLYVAGAGEKEITLYRVKIPGMFSDDSGEETEEELIWGDYE